MATAETSRFRARIEARRARAAAGIPAGPVPTAEDDRNLADFEADTVAVTELLQSEIAAIRAGKLDLVTELYPRKAALLKRIELLLPVVEPFLKDKVRRDARLAEGLAALKRAVQEDSALLERMSVATGEIVRDIEKIRDRHSLNGLYGKSGRRVTGPGSDLRKIDKTI